MVSRKNIKYKLQQEAKQVPHYGIRKLSIGVASVLLSTVFYMQNGTVHADVNSTVSTGNNSAKVISENSGTNSSTVFSNTSNRTDSGNSVGAINSMATGQPLVSPVERVTTQVRYVPSVASEPESGASANKVNAGIDLTSGSGPVQNRPVNTPVNASTENPNNERLFTNFMINPSFLTVSKVASTGTLNNVTNGGFDQSTWGTLDVSKWTGQENNGVYELTGYTGDLEHIIVPNSADFAKAGRNVGRVGISADTTHSWFEKGRPKSIAFSKTDGQMVKAIGSDWTSAFTGFYRYVVVISHASELTLFDGNNLDVSNIMNMSHMFTQNKLTDLSGISNWKTYNVTNMGGMFAGNQISDLTPLVNWKTDNVTNMGGMFAGNQISDLTPLVNWKTDNVTSMHGIFFDNQISNLTSLVNWKTDNVTDMSYMFNENQISDLAPLANWKTNNVTDMSYMFDENRISDLTPLANWKTDNVTDMEDIFYNNQITYADFTKWNFSKVQNLAQLISQWVPAIIVIKNSDQALFSYRRHINIKQNQLHFGTDTIDMPTIYVASDKADARQKILADIKTKLADYQKSQAGVDIKPVKPLDQLTELVDLANAKFTVVKRTLSELDTNDAFALNPVNGLHEHKNVNDNGGYDTDFWGTLDVSKFTTVKNGDNLEITGYNADASKVIIPNIADFWVNGLDQGAKQVTISSSVMHYLAKNATRIGLSKTNNQKVVAGDANWQDAFGGMTNEPNTSSNVYGGMWVYNPNLTTMDLHNLDTTNITDMGSMFNGGRNLSVVGDLSQWNVSNVVDMKNMFHSASSLTNIGDLSNWDTSKVTDMHWMFGGTMNLTNIGDLSKWQTGNVTDMNDMFYYATNLTNIGDLSKWQTGNVTNMAYMFTNASRLTNIGDLSKWQTGNVTNITYMFVSTNALRHLNISNWNLTKLANKDSMKYMFANDTDLTIIANDLVLPTWYQNEINDAAYFWSSHMAVITNVPELISATGDINNLKIDKQNASRSIFYDSKGSDDAIQVLKDANQAYIKQYQNDHPGYILNLAADVDQTDPIALANANFISAPREVQFTIAYYDLTGKIVNSTTSTHKVGDTVSISPVAPDNYVLANGQLRMNYSMHWGLNEADFLVVPKVTMSTETKTVSRTITVQAPNGQINNVVQTVTFVRNGYLNQVTKQTTYSPWSFGGQYQFNGYQPKPIDGYTADVASGVIITPDSSDTVLSLTYHKQAAVYSVDYQLANGTVVKNVSVAPESGGLIHLMAPQGYRLLTPVTDMQVGHSSQKLAVLVVPDEQTYTTKDTLPSGVKEPLTKAVIRKVIITMPNGRTRTITQTVRFERTATVKADGTVAYSNWNSIGRAQFNRVFVPKRHGYHLVITDASGKALSSVDKIDNVTGAMNDAVVTVKYVQD